MKSQLGVFALAVLICCALAIVFCTWFWLDAACLVEGRRVAMKTTGSVGCFEFWLNRYQTMIAAILAVAAAFFTIRATRQQTMAAMASNENVARIFAYDALRSFVRRGGQEIFEIDKFERENPHGQRSAGAPQLDLGKDKTAIAHLPPALVKRTFLLEGITAGISINSGQLRAKNVPLVHIYERCALAKDILTAVKLAEDIGEPIGVFADPLGEETAEYFKKRASEFPSTDSFEAVVEVLMKEAARRNGP